MYLEVGERLSKVNIIVKVIIIIIISFLAISILF